MSATRFVVICFARTGSNWLCELLDSHPAILCHREVFSPDAIYYAPGHGENSETAAAWTMEARNREPAVFLADVFADDRGHDAVGVKFLDWHQPELLSDLARDRTVRKVILRRENRVRAFLSRTRARVIWRWSDQSYDGMRVRLDVDELLAYAERYDRFYTALAAATAGSPTHQVTYERMLEDPREVQRVVEFLGIQPVDYSLRSNLQPQSRDRLREVLMNFDELTAALAGTSLHAELHE